MRAGRAAVAVAILALPLTSCTTPGAVSQFCASAITTLTTAETVFGDMKQSCLREVNSRADFGTFTPPVGDNDAGCAAIGKQTDGAVAAAKVLSDYFSAINALASFGTAKVATDARNLTTKTGAAVGINSPAQTALGSIAGFLVSTATSGYQVRALKKDLPKASSDIAAVTGAMVTIVQDDYIGRLLRSEEQKLSVHYKEFAKDKSPEVKLMLDARWQNDEQALAARRASAGSLVAALQALTKGFADLAANAGQLNAKEVPGLLAPYVTQIQALIPQIQQAF